MKIKLITTFHLHFGRNIEKPAWTIRTLNFSTMWRSIKKRKREEGGRDMGAGSPQSPSGLFKFKNRIYRGIVRAR